MHLGYSTDADLFEAMGCIKKVNLKSSKDRSGVVGATIVEDVVDTATGEILF